MKRESLVGHAEELVRIIRKSTLPADAVASAYLRERSYIGATDRRYIGELVFRTLRQLSLADALSTEDRPPAATMDDDGVQEWIQHELATKELAVRFVDESTWCGFAPWIITELERRWTHDDVLEVGRAMMLPAPLCIRVYRRRATRQNVLAVLRKDNISCEEGKLSPDAIIIHQRVNLLQHPLYKEGIIDVQDEGSQLIGLFCDVEPGQHVLDACAGAGGKSLHLADIMKDSGVILARDIEFKRLKEIRPRARRVGLTSITTELLSARPDSARRTHNQHIAYDLVLVDAPCSGMGTIRRSPMVKWRLTQEGLSRIVQKQQHILQTNSQYVRPDGHLVYATCSILPSENEDVVQHFLAHNPDFTLIDERQVDPYHNGTDGLYMARMRRGTQAYAG